MNEVFENNMKFAPLLKFYYRYKVIILSSLFAVITITAISLFLSAASERNHEKAAVIYNDWAITTSITPSKLTIVMATNGTIGILPNG